MPEGYDRGVRVVSSTADRLEYENTAREVAADGFLSQSSSIDSRSGVHVRNATPLEDMNANDETAANAAVTPDDPTWETTFGTGEDRTWLGWYAVDNRDRAEDKGVVHWGYQLLSDDTVETPAISVRVRNRTGGLIDQHDLQSLVLDDDNTILIENPLTVSTQSLFYEIYSDVADATIKFKPLVTVAEEEGGTLEDADRFVA
jgi:hypothetical protein